MATPKIWRDRDNFLISDRCIAWDRWQETSGVQENELLIGGIFHMEQLGNPHTEGTVTFKFAPDYPTSPLSNIEILKACRRDLEIVRFQDFEGNTYLCEIVTDLDIKPHGVSRVVQRDAVTINLRRAGSI